MQTKTLVQATANIVTITNLAEGDVYKRLHKNNYETDYKLYLGVVTGIMHNGEEAAITAIEFEENYSSVRVQLQVFAGDSEVALYHATPDEITSHMNTLRETSQKEIDRKEKELADAIGVRSRIDTIIDMAGAGQLKAAATKGIEK